MIVLGLVHSSKVSIESADASIYSVVGSPPGRDLGQPHLTFVRIAILEYSWEADRENMGSKIKSDFLFAQPSLLSGAARLVDFYALFDEYNISPTEVQADALAAFSDWAIVGKDLQEALQQYELQKCA
jgi:hypothetical protein